MDSGWAAVVVALGALVFSGFAVVISNRATGYAKSQAEAADRQAAAAEASVEYMRRQVEAMEREPAPPSLPVTSSSPPLVDGARPKRRRAPYVSPWSVIPRGSGGFILANGSAEPAYDVQIAFDVPPARLDKSRWERIDARATVRVIMIRAFGASPNELTVRWRRSPDGELIEWATAL